MNVADVEKLNAAVEFLIKQESFQHTVEQLGEDICHSRDSFVWSVIDLNTMDRELPEHIKSCWVFVLKRDVPSGCHYHPNSIQHMVTIKGQGNAKVGGIFTKMVPFGSANDSPENKWYVIGRGVPHEFFPSDEDMVVVSFHNCDEHELEEVDCETGVRRLYEG